MDAHRVAEMSDGTGSWRVNGGYQNSSGGYTLDVNEHHVNTATKLGKACLGINHDCHYLQQALEGK